MSKGDKRRQRQIDRLKYAINWDIIFNTLKEMADEVSNEEEEETKQEAKERLPND